MFHSIHVFCNLCVLKRIKRMEKNTKHDALHIKSMESLTGHHSSNSFESNQMDQNDEKIFGAWYSEFRLNSVPLWNNGDHRSALQCIRTFSIWNKKREEKVVNIKCKCLFRVPHFTEIKGKKTGENILCFEKQLINESTVRCFSVHEILAVSSAVLALR